MARGRLWGRGKEGVETSWKARAGQVVPRWNAMWKSLKLILEKWSPQDAVLVSSAAFHGVISGMLSLGGLACTQLPCRNAALGPGAAFYSLFPAVSNSCLSGTASGLPFPGR